MIPGLPRDRYSTPVPVTGPKFGTGQKITTGVAAVLSAQFQPDTVMVKLHATADCFYELGGADVVANNSTSHFLPANTPTIVSLWGSDPNVAASYLSVLQSTATGTLYLSEMG